VTVSPALLIDINIGRLCKTDDNDDLLVSSIIKTPLSTQQRVSGWTIRTNRAYSDDDVMIDILMRLPWLQQQQQLMRTSTDDFNYTSVRHRADVELL